MPPRPQRGGKEHHDQGPCHIAKETSGSVSIGGHDIDKEANTIGKIIGVQSQETVVEGEMTGRQNLMFQGHLQRMRGRVLETRVDELLSIMELSSVADKRSRVC